jgi:hypothetical protein
VRAIRLRAQRLGDTARSRPASVAGIVRQVGGIQAQDETAAALGVRARGRGINADDIAHARDSERSVVRTWCMRGTLHLIPADVLPTVLAAFGPVYVARGRRRLADFGLDDDASTHATAIIGDVLAESGPLRRTQIATALERHGIAGDPHDRATFHLVRRACLLGIACEVGPGGAEPSYARPADWLPTAPPADRTAALGEVARWYLAAYQPASPDDFAAWSGLPAHDVRSGWTQAGELVAVGDGPHPLWCRAEDGPVEAVAPGAPQVRLLPAFDGYLLGYRGRHHAVAPEDAARVHPGGGIIRATVLVDGRVAGIWRIDRRRGRLVVESFAGLPGAPIAALDAEVDDIARFLGLDLALTMVG